ncbi:MULTISPECIES: MCE family protein [Nocardioides]|uniref:MCE family protein n=1 Tax=Nocardioides TaxID=1839 RepID=UPI00032DDE61|nr:MULTISPECIES: MCE family protein [Nocardioides]EON23777.1 virulence factor Mce family protein [Nocardioides sp. CF8]
MLVNIHHDSKAEHLRLLVAGVAYLTAMALLIALSIAIYQKKFIDVTTIKVQADRAGLQLAKFGDVRMHGALVGDVRAIEQDGEQAVITLALRPEAARTIPDNVEVEILPTTLFGQKYVSLVPPTSNVSPTMLTDNAVIPASRVRTNVEIQTVLANLFPLLRAVKPADLNATLYALSHALTGKGDDLGETLEELDAYLIEINDHLPQLRTDMKLLAEVAQTYELAAPDLLRLLRNATVSARTLVQKKAEFGETLRAITGLSVSTRNTLSANEQALIQQGRYGVPLLSLLDTYSPQLPCMLDGIVRQKANTQNVFQDGIIHQTLELGAPQRKSYTAADAPVYGEVGHGPWCLGLPANYQNPAPFLPLKDGTSDDEPGGGLE